MDWDFLNIFKKAEFNTLMLSVAITGWILFIIGMFKEYSLIAALITSIYCAIRVIIYCYQTIISTRKTKINDKQKEREKEIKEKEYEENRRIEISRMFEGLSDSNKFILASILLNGKKDAFNYNVLLFPKYGRDYTNIYMAQEISMIYRTGYGGGQNCIIIKEYTDSISVTIDSILYEIIEKYINKEKNN